MSTQSYEVDGQPFRLHHSDASTERTLAAAERVEAAVGRMFNGDRRAIGKIDPGDLALLVQYARDAAGPHDPFTSAALLAAIADAEARGRAAALAEMAKV